MSEYVTYLTQSDNPTEKHVEGCRPIRIRQSAGKWNVPTQKLASDPILPIGAFSADSTAHRWSITAPLPLSRLRKGRQSFQRIFDCMPSSSKMLPKTNTAPASSSKLPLSLLLLCLLEHLLHNLLLLNQKRPYDPVLDAI